MDNSFKVTSVLTTLDCEYHAPFGDQIDSIKSMSEFFERINLMSKDPPPGIRGVVWNAFGLFPSIREGIAFSLARMLDNQACAIAAPNVLVNQNWSGLYQKLAEHGQNLGQTWGCSCRLGPDEVPSMFVLPAKTMAHIYNAIPDRSSFRDESWRAFIDEWLDSKLKPGRYFDATSFGLIKDFPPPPVAIKTPVETPKPKKAK